ncbi:MAG: TRAP transporter small permease subunit [Rhodocyclaceae bacterium]|nr:TRAP transporter small permease subunit [Rhodocyclaceae bacterium]
MNATSPVEGGAGKGAAAPAGALRLLDRASFYLNEGLAWAAALALGAMMLFSVADMVMRGMGRTVAGSYEVIGWLSAAAMALALGTVQRHRGHVAMELVVTKLGQRSQAIVEALMALLSLLLFATAAWYVARYGQVLDETGSLSETLRVVVYPWVYLVAAGCAGLTLALLVDFLRAAHRLLALDR